MDQVVDIGGKLLQDMDLKEWFLGIIAFALVVQTLGVNDISALILIVFAAAIVLFMFVVAIEELLGRNQSG